MMSLLQLITIVIGMFIIGITFALWLRLSIEIATNKGIKQHKDVYNVTGYITIR